MKQTKTTIRELRRFYKGVLLNCLAIIAGLAIAVNAEATSLNVDTSNLTVSGSSLSGTATVDVTGLATTDITDFDTTVTGLANTAIDTSIASGSLQTALGAKADATDVYTKTEVDTSLSAKADSADLTALSDAVGTTITSTGSLNGSEIGNGTTVAGALGTLDSAVAQNAVDIATKANATDVYTKTEVDTSLSAKADSADLTALSDAVGTTITSTGSLNGSEIGNGTTVAGALGTLDSAVAQNTADIATKADATYNGTQVTGQTDTTLADAVDAAITQVNTNTTAIAQNATDIATKADSAYSGTQVNGQSDATLADAVDAAITQVNTNTTAIAQNAADIATKADSAYSGTQVTGQSDATLADAVDAAITQVNTNTADITQNTDSITTLQGIVGDGLSAQTGLANIETTDTLTDAVVKLDTAVKGNSDTIAQNTADIAQNTADIAQNTADIAQNTADIAQNTATIGAGTPMGTSGVLASETLGSNPGEVTVAGALGVLSDTIGNMSLSTQNGNFSDASSTVTEALSDLDLALGDRNWEGYDKGIGDSLASNSSVSDAVAQLNTNIGSSSDLDGGTHVSSGTSIYGNLASLDATIGGAIGANSNTVLADATLGDGSAGTVTVAGALGSVSNAIGTLTYENTASVSYDPIATGSDLTTAVSQVASNIGTATTSAINGVQANATVNANIDAINNTIGDMSTLSARDEQASVGDSLTNGTGTAPVTVVEALNNIDATLGQIHGLSDKLAVNGAGTNLATGTTVEDHLTAVDAAIGDRTNIGSANVAINNATATSVASGLQTVGNTIGDMDFSATGYLSGTTDLSSGLRTLDSQLYGVHSDVQRLENEVRGGFASMAALSALVPNARAAGDTQLSMGTGVYRDRAGFAIGAFHYLNDNTLLNVGGAYGGSKSGVVRAGVTFGW